MRAQIGQTMTYILALVILASILMYGYNTIVGTRQQTSMVQNLQLREQLVKDIGQIKNKVNEIRTKQYMIEPFQKICFIDRETFPLTQPPGDNLEIEAKRVLEGTDNNVVFIGSQGTDEMFIEGIKLDREVRCFEAENSVLKLKLVSKGDRVSIET